MPAKQQPQQPDRRVTVRWIGPTDECVPGVPAADHETDADTAAALCDQYPRLYTLTGNEAPAKEVPGG